MTNKKEKYIKITEISYIILLIIILTTSGCLNQESPENKEAEKIQAIVSIPPQREMVEEIGGEKVEVTVLVPPGVSPHSYDLLPSQIETISNADIYFKVGSGVEFELSNMEEIKSQNPELKIVDLSKNIKVKSWDEHHGKTVTNKISKEGKDQHIWMSPLNGIKMSENVYQALISIDPSNKEYYKQNLDEYTEKLQDLHKDIKQLLEPYENKSFLVYHPSFGYLGDTYNLTQIGIEEGGQKPGPEGISKVIDQAQRQDINVIFVSPQFDTSSAEVIANEINGEVVTANPLAGNYSNNLLEIAKKMEEGFSN